ncbi:hypothetical protein [Streptomyces sp. NBC_00328]|uniref:hypothetical protein n=1 Tax=Streptomyces sp. NBC_00328 TaxID=2903646 RepID=UPI002E2BDB30|nr:hypothetical protein [Streptomyces sp. NBC_00328]
MRALVVQHDHVTEPGLVGARLEERGYDLTVMTVVPEHRHHAPDVEFDFFGTETGLGVQFHPGITTAMVRGRIEAGGAEQRVRHGVDPGGLPARSRAMEPMARANARRLVDGFLGRAADRAG